MSSLIPFLVLSAFNQHMIYEDHIKSNSSYRSSSDSFTSPAYLPENVATIINDANNRKNNGISYFDVLIMRAVHGDEKVQQIVLKINDKFEVIHKQAKNKIATKLNDIAKKTQKLNNEMFNQLKELKEIGFDVKKIDINFGYTDKDENKNYLVRGIYPSEMDKKGYVLYYYDFPIAINELEINSDTFKLANPYEKLLNDYIKENSNNEALLKIAESNLKMAQKNKLLRFFSQKRKINLFNAEQEYNQCKAILNKKTRLEKYAKFYKSLTIEQKNILINYIDNIKKMRELCSQADKYTEIQNYIEKNNSRACPTKKINEYYSDIIKKAAKSLTKEEIITLSEFSEKTANKILNLSNKQAIEILKNSAGLSSKFDIDGKLIETNILYELSDSCCEIIQEINAAKAKDNNMER